MGLADTSTVAVPLYTLTDPQAVGSTGNGWEWQYRGLYQGGTESEWLPEGEVRDSLNSLQLDVQGKDCRPRPPEPRSTASVTRGFKRKRCRTFRQAHR